MSIFYSRTKRINGHDSYFCKVDTQRVLNKDPLYHALYEDDSLIRGARLVCSLAILENVILRRTFGVVFDSVNS